MNYPDIVSEPQVLPKSLANAFMQWLLNGGYDFKVKKDGVHFFKGKTSAIIYCKSNSKETSFQFNEHCKIRFMLFCKQWLAKGVEFVDTLNTEIEGRIKESRQVIMKNQRMSMIL